VAGASEPPPPPPADPTVVDDAEDFAGVYRRRDGAPSCVIPGEAGAELTLVADGGRLVLSAGDVRVAFERREPDVFVAPHPAWDGFYLRAGRDAAGRMAELFYGPHVYVAEGCGDAGAPTPTPEWQPFLGHYRSWNIFAPDVRVFERRGRLLLSGPSWMEGPGGEMELVPLGEAVFRIGVEDWRPDRLRFDAVVDGRATRVFYNQAPLYRAFTP
jgi:hypothetical protein